MYTTHRMGRGGHCQQFDTTSTLISVPQWLHRPCNASMQLYRVGKKPSVKADLAMHSHAADVSRRCMSVSLILGCKFDSSFCAVRAGFHKSSHIQIPTYDWSRDQNKNLLSQLGPWLFVFGRYSRKVSWTVKTRWVKANRALSAVQTVVCDWICKNRP